MAEIVQRMSEMEDGQWGEGSDGETLAKYNTFQQTLTTNQMIIRQSKQWEFCIYFHKSFDHSGFSEWFHWSRWSRWSGGSGWLGGKSGPGGHPG